MDLQQAEGEKGLLVKQAMHFRGKSPKFHIWLYCKLDEKWLGGSKTVSK